MRSYHVSCGILGFAGFKFNTAACFRGAKTLHRKLRTVGSLDPGRSRAKRQNSRLRFGI